jgi:transcriptional regulator with XRE-family HTH domain
LTSITFSSIFPPESEDFLIHGGYMSTFNPDMLKIARDLRGMSQTELVQNMKNITQAALSKIEKGDLKPSEETKQQLAKALNFPERFLLSLITLKFLQLAFTHIEKATTTAKVLSQINAEMTIKAANLETLNIFSQLDEKLPLPSYQIHINVSTASEAAQNLRKKWGLGLNPIENLTEIIEQSGVYIFYCDFAEDHIDGVSLQTQNCPPCIFLNKNQPNDRIRFTLAHELGHLVLHKFAPSIDMEDEANEFAAEFLVPTEAIKGQLRTTNLKTYATNKLAWKVSMAALIVKAKHRGY